MVERQKGSSPVPALTVLLPAGNDAHALLLTLRDLCGQSFTDFEVLVLDDGATAATGSAIDWDVDDHRVRVIRVEERGDGAVLNRGLELVRGDLIVRVAAGDVSSPDRLERQASLLAVAPELAFVVTGWRSVNADGSTYRRVSPSAADAGLRAAMATGDAMGHPTAMMRREAVQKACGWRPAFVGLEDYDLLMRLLDRHRGAAVPETLVECKAPSVVLGWRALEQSMLSEMAAVAAHDRRQVGRPDHGDRTSPVDRAVLHRMGMTEEEVAQGLINRALAAAQAAGAAGEWRPMREAAWLGLQQEALPAGMKSQFVRLWLRSVARLKPGRAGPLEAVGGRPGLSPDRG